MPNSVFALAAAAKGETDTTSRRAARWRDQGTDHVGKGQIKPPGIGPRVKSSTFPLARVPFWVPTSDPQPCFVLGKGQGISLTVIGQRIFGLKNSLVEIRLGFPYETPKKLNFSQGGLLQPSKGLCVSCFCGFYRETKRTTAILGGLVREKRSSSNGVERHAPLGIASFRGSRLKCHC